MSFDFKLINNDLKIGSNGKIETVTDTNKLKQDIIKIILTPVGSVSKHPWYGCAIDDNVIGRNLPSSILHGEIQRTIVESLNKLQKLQIQQSAVQKVSLAEMISVIADVYSKRNYIDGRQIDIVITVLTKKLGKIEELFTITS
jgi:phage baseplate assembly protein W